MRNLGFAAEAETSGNIGGKHPDICFNRESDGARVVIEAEYQNRRGAEKDALKRLDEFPRPAILCAVSYPAAIARDYRLAGDVNQWIDYAFWSAEEEWPWGEGKIADFAESMRRAKKLPISSDDKAISDAVMAIQTAINSLAKEFIAMPGAAEQAAKILGIVLPESNREEARDDAVRMAGLIMISAFIFQAALARKNSKVKNPIVIAERKGDSARNVAAFWRFILKEINYVAVFEVAADLMESCLPEKNQVQLMIDTAIDVRDVAKDGYDLMGRAYHYLLRNAKTLGAFYTSLPGATLLAGLALAKERWTNVDWNSADAVGELKIADLACGTGTLLAATCWKARDNFLRTGGKSVDELHKNLIERTIWGYDILGSAVHLTAATLGLMSPEINFRRAHIYQSVIGRKEKGDTAVGSLELLESRVAQDRLFVETGMHVETKEKPAELPDLDLCIMNPPFVVGRASALSYGFLPEKERDAVRQRINALAKKHEFSYAGLGPAFVALGEKYVKPGGRLAFILSTTLASGRGKAWESARARIEKDCDLEFFIASRDTSRSNFSENTNLQECMFVARKRQQKEKPSNKAMFAVLTENPRSTEAAIATASSILRGAESNDEYGKLRIAEREIGEFAFLNYRDRAVWDGIAFRNLRLTMAADIFADEGSVRPYSTGKARIPITPFENLAKFGSHHLHCFINEDKHRRLHFSATKTSYAGYYPGHYKRETGIAQKDIARIKESPNCYLLPLPDCEEWTRNYFAKGGRIVINGSFRFNTARRLASLISVRVQGANYQPIRLNKETVQRAKAMVLWLNSTPALLLIATHAVYCEGAKVMFSQQAAKDLPVLNLDALSESQIKSLARAFDSVAKMKLRPLPEMTKDPARKKIDDALKSALKLDGFDFPALRAALANEPIIQGGR